MPRKRYPRRKFIRDVGALAGGATLLSGCGKAPSRQWRFFTEAEAGVLAAVWEQIIPADQDPGAVDAGVPNFIDLQLTRHYKRHQETYRTGLEGVQQTSTALYGRRFEELKWDDQTRVLETLESGKAPGSAWASRNPRTFFNLVRDHSMQGFYGSPRHGGNRNYVSYRMLGIDYPQVIGQNRYE